MSKQTIWLSYCQAIRLIDEQANRDLAELPTIFGAHNWVAAADIIGRRNRLKQSAFRAALMESGEYVFQGEGI